MNVQEILNSISKMLDKANKNGIPLPMLRDPQTGTASVTLTMVWISFNIAIITLAGKITRIIGDVDYQSVLWLFGLTLGVYLGRKVQKGPSSLEIEKEENKKEV